MSALTILLFVIVIVSAMFVVAGVRGAIWVPAFSKDLAVILPRLHLKKGTKVYEFGCGDGRFLRLAAAHGAVAIGYEINPLMALFANILSRNKNVHVTASDAWRQSFHEADVVFAFLMPQFMERLSEKMRAELQPGTIVVTYMYPLPGMESYLHEGNAYFYRIGKKVL